MKPQKTEMNKLSNSPLRSRSAPPKASSMVEALRGLGYTTATAIADLIDNSLTADAAKVEIDFHWEGEGSWIRILDDGRGMTDGELDKAMRIGETNPLHIRAEADLGRFGLGLKTASFSQARRLTVTSLKAGELSQLRWDLDLLAASSNGDWLLLEGAHSGSEMRCRLPEGAVRGTTVVWECLDRIVTPSFSEQDFLDLIDQTEKHLRMVFHRYLDGSGRSIDVLINGKKIKPWDPFLSAHGSTWRSPEVHVGQGDLRITAQAFVLPHKDRLNQKDYLDSGGPEGWASQQGFYIYRLRRLLVAGSWLGLGRGRSWAKDESHRLARIRVDISNSADSDWRIDIRKASAQPPVVLRDQLTRIAEDARDRARRVFLFRAITNTNLGHGRPIMPVWISEQLASGRRYRVDRNHPAIADLAEEGGELKERLEVLLRVIEQTVPVQRIWLEAAESGEQARGGFTSDETDAAKQVLEALYHRLVRIKGLTPDEAREKLLRSEPFDLHPELVASLGRN